MKLIPMGQGLGDHLAVTAFVREFKKKWPEELVMVDSHRYPFVWDHNPRINWGKEEMLGTIQINHKRFEDMGNMPTQMCADLGFLPADTRPEIFLTERECGYGKLALTGLPQGLKKVAMDYHATGIDRRWPLVRFQELAKLLQARRIVIVEIGNNLPMLASDRALSKHLHVRQTAAILKECDLYVGNDSGSFHLAASVGIRQVVLFGPTKSKSFAYESTSPFDKFWDVYPPAVASKVFELLETDNS